MRTYIARHAAQETFEEFVQDVFFGQVRTVSAPNATDITGASNEKIDLGMDPVAALYLDDRCFRA